MGLLKSKQEKEFLQKQEAIKATNRLKKHIETLEASRINYINKAKNAHLAGSASLYEVARNGLASCIAQQKAAEELLTNMELLAQGNAFASISNSTVVYMNKIAKDLNKNSKGVDFSKAALNFHKAAQSSSKHSENLNVMLESNRISSAEFTNGIKNSELDGMIGVEAVESEKLFDTKLDDILNNTKTKAKPQTVVVGEVSKKEEYTEEPEKIEKIETIEKKIETKKEDAPKIEVVKKGEGVNFEPQSLSDLIGQTKTIRELREDIMVAKHDGLKCIANKGGILLTGNKGLGKTTIMDLVAKELGVPYKFFDAASMRNDVASRRVFDQFLENIARANKPVVIGVDEIHALPNDIQTRLLTLLAKRVYTGIDAVGDTFEMPIDQFTFIGATTDQQLLLEPLLDRFNKGRICNLEDYTMEELNKIIKLKFASFNFTVADDANREIAKRGRSSVREIESYILKLRGQAVIAGKTHIDMDLVNKFFKYSQIDENGLNQIDLVILNALLNAPKKTLSEENLSSKVGITQKIFVAQHKPYLFKRGYIAATNQGLTLTKDGMNMLDEKASAGEKGGAQQYEEKQDYNTQNTNSTTHSTQVIASGDLQTDILELLTGKYAKQVVNSQVIASELNADIKEVTEALKPLKEERLVNLKVDGFVATLQGYEKLGKKFEL
ncbi:MAG: AAA family ATPase [Firmicutes bacterium]|nr:AAA family ATPase [Bacillota bacterium]